MTHKTGLCSRTSRCLPLMCQWLTHSHSAQAASSCCCTGCFLPLVCQRFTCGFTTVLAHCRGQTSRFFPLMPMRAGCHKQCYEHHSKDQSITAVSHNHHSFFICLYKDIPSLTYSACFCNRKKRTSGFLHKDRKTEGKPLSSLVIVNCAAARCGNRTIELCVSEAGWGIDPYTTTPQSFA